MAPTRNLGRTLVGEELNLAEHEAIINVRRVRVRVSDDEIRKAAKEFASICVAASMGVVAGQDDAAARAAALAARADMESRTEPLQEAIGERIRSLA